MCFWASLVSYGKARDSWLTVRKQSMVNHGEFGDGSSRHVFDSCVIRCCSTWKVVKMKRCVERCGDNVMWRRWIEQDDVQWQSCRMSSTVLRVSETTIRDPSSTTGQMDAVRRLVNRLYSGWFLLRCTRRWKHISQHRWWKVLTVRWFRRYAENVSKLTFMVGEKPGRTKDIVLFRRGTAFSLEGAYVGIRRWPGTNLGDKMRRHPYSRRRSLGLNAAAIL